MAIKQAFQKRGFAKLDESLKAYGIRALPAFE
jgi:hypothetical protein